MTGLLAQLGAAGVFLLMMPESACLPIPSELTLITAGFGVHAGWFSFPVAVLAATAGNLIGSLIAYWLGQRDSVARFAQRRAVLARCERLFVRRGNSTVFIARLLPLARSFVSLPAGYFGVPLVPFVALTVAGCAIWSAAFVLLGLFAGAAWQTVASTAGRLSLAVGALTLAGCALALSRGRRSEA
jgi:membrane protein DedA with SNARE-associated domain